MNLCQYKDALSDAKKSVELDPTFPKAYLRIIKSCILLGDIVQAQATLNKAQQTLPDPDQYPLKQFQDTIDYLNRFLKEGANACAAQDYRKVRNNNIEKVAFPIISIVLASILHRSLFTNKSVVHGI